MLPISTSGYNERENMFMWRVITPPTYPTRSPANNILYLSAICGDSLMIRTVSLKAINILCVLV